MCLSERERRIRRLRREIARAASEIEWCDGCGKAPATVALPALDAVLCAKCANGGHPIERTRAVVNVFENPCDECYEAEACVITDDGRDLCGRCELGVIDR